jgi:hypothetical protein
VNVRLYTVEEAREALPVVRPLLQDLVEPTAEVRRLQAVVTATRRASLADGNLVADAMDETPEEDSPLMVAQVAARRCMSELAEMGIEVKDPARGLIDFYHRRDGDVVFLCYLLGEPDILYWHTLQGGFAGRQPL